MPPIRKDLTSSPVAATAVRALGDWRSAWEPTRWLRGARSKKPATKDAAGKNSGSRAAVCPKGQLGSASSDSDHA